MKDIANEIQAERVTLILIAEDLSKWLEEMSVKYKKDQCEMQEIIKSFLIG